MYHLPGLGDYPLDVIIWIGIAIVIGGGLIGHLTDAVMGDRGFGVAGNAFLAILGALVGIYARTALFGRLYSQDLMITAIVAAATATGMLLLLGIAKHYVQD